MEMTIRQFSEFSGKYGFDIGDNTWDWGNYFECSKDIDGGYDEFCDFVANNLVMICYRDNWYSTCKITEFLAKYDKAFRKFTNEYNGENWQLGDYEIESDEWFEIIFATFDSLINGNYNDNSYSALVKLLKECE